MTNDSSSNAGIASATLDALLRHATQRRPNGAALIDPPNRPAFTDGAPRRLSFPEVEHMVSLLAHRFQSLGLPTGAVVGVQLPNTIENVVTILALMRARLVVAPLPLLWRRADMAAALGRIGAKAIVTARRIDSHDACTTAMQVAADVFPIRHVCGFGSSLPDGVVDLSSALAEDQPSAAMDDAGTGRDVALVSFDVTPRGAVAVARNQPELIAGGIAALLEAGIPPGARILAGCALGSFAGCALTAVPWLLSAGALSLHHPFDPTVFAAQGRDDGCDTVIAPGVLIPQLADAGLLLHPGLRSVLGLWRAPERREASPPWQHRGVTLTDMLAFGETAVFGLRRGPDGLPMAMPAHAVMPPAGSVDAKPVLEFVRTRAGTVAMRGAMVPQRPFPPGAERVGFPHMAADAGGFVDTSYPCRLDGSSTMTLIGPPSGLVHVGGYRFVLNELEATVRRVDGAAFVAALPDSLAGHRLAGIDGGSDIRSALAERGANPLLVDAFPP